MKIEEVERLVAAQQQVAFDEDFRNAGRTDIDGNERH